jgi:adenosylcobinamide kinase/adenosylcobinamide-phosphate guanylyltransferase
MIALVSGGSGSGKSAYAEDLAVALSHGEGLVYIATMQPFGEEALNRVEKHRAMRSNKGFTTLEVYHDLHTVRVGSGSTVLLECLSNLLANEMFSEDPPNDVVSKVLSGILHLSSSSKHLVVVSNEIFSDGCPYGDDTLRYIRNLGILNQSIAKRCDSVVECVFGNAITYK